MSMKRLIALAGLVIVLGLALYFRPVPLATAAPDLPRPAQSPAINLPWPTSGEAALGAQGYGILASHGSDKPLPIASTAKVITALAILRKQPIAAGSQGPIITLTQKDVDLFDKYYLNDGSVAQVQAGEQITEYQALQAMLLPSANNLADTMAAWAFGSVDAYVAYANNMVRSMGLNQTTVGDATGFNDSTFSTASDLTKLALATMDNPVIAGIVRQPSAQLPVAGTVQNVNWLLGQDGVVGIKTGNTDNAGGCYLFAAQRPVLGRQIIVVGAILDDTSLNDAIHQADAIIKTSDNGFERATLIKKGQALGSYHAPWGASAPIMAEQDLSMLAWKGQPVKASIVSQPIQAPAAAGSPAGKITLTSGRQSASGSLVLANDLPGPSLTWRLLHR